MNEDTTNQNPLETLTMRELLDRQHYFEVWDKDTNGWFSIDIGSGGTSKYKLMYSRQGSKVRDVYLGDVVLNHDKGLCEAHRRKDGAILRLKGRVADFVPDIFILGSQTPEEFEHEYHVMETQLRHNNWSRVVPAFSLKHYMETEALCDLNKARVKYEQAQEWYLRITDAFTKGENSETS